MKNMTKSAVAAVGLLGSLYAVPSFAACIAGPYVSQPTVAYPDTLQAALDTKIWVHSYMSSPNGVYKLTIQEDGNLVLYKNGTQARWASGRQNCIPTPYSAGFYKFQSDGNLVVYYIINGTETPVWDTNTWGHPNARLVLQDDGNLVIYDSNNHVLWAVF